MSADSRSCFMRSTQSLAVEYGVSARTIRRWKKKGAPFDSPAEMVEFIRQQQRRGIQRLSVVAPQSEPAAAGVDVSVPFPENDNLPLDLANGLGTDATLERYRQAELHAAQEYARSIGTRDVGAAFNRWIIATDQWRKVEAASIEFKKETGDLVDRAEINEACTAVIVAAEEIINAIPTRMALSLEGLDALSIEAKLKEEVRRIRAAFADLPI